MTLSHSATSLLYTDSTDGVLHLNHGAIIMIFAIFQFSLSRALTLHLPLFQSFTTRVLVAS